MEIMEELTKMLLQKMKAMISITTTMAGMIIVESDCVADGSGDFVEGPGKGRSGGQSGGKGIRRPGGTGAAKLACVYGTSVEVYGLFVLNILWL
ncbi:hypothetical protein Bca52824_086069 [Brassica carinata]|uniref:Uncharacterized protein n=1 Tax=Brassica carinata TaxID=52824 RepID=A0A8X7TNF8_BRACI|nr:hypothetical protein Bca52824_086069 [Brassica carinata]